MPSVNIKRTLFVYVCVSRERVRHEIAKSVYLRCLPMPVMPLHTRCLVHSLTLIYRCLCSLLLMLLYLSSLSSRWVRGRETWMCWFDVCVSSALCLHVCIMQYLVLGMFDWVRWTPHWGHCFTRNWQWTLSIVSPTLNGFPSDKNTMVAISQFDPDNCWTLWWVFYFVF